LFTEHELNSSRLRNTCVSVELFTVEFANYAELVGKLRTLPLKSARPELEFSSVFTGKVIQVNGST